MMEVQQTSVQQSAITKQPTYNQVSPGFSPQSEAFAAPGPPTQAYAPPGPSPQGYGPPQGYASSQQTTTNTVVMINQQPTKEAGPRQWSTGLCGCFEDCGSCMFGLFCFNNMVMSVSGRMGEGCCLPCCFPPIALFGLRIKLRTEQNIEGSICKDYMAIQCCPQLAVCQLSRELKNLGR